MAKYGATVTRDRIRTARSRGQFLCCWASLCRPLGACFFLAKEPTAGAVGCILAPLRGWALPNNTVLSLLAVLCRWFGLPCSRARDKTDQANALGLGDL